MINRIFALYVVLLILTVFAYTIKSKNVIDDVIEERQPLLYKTNHTFSFSSNEFFCMAKNIFYEAGIESDLGKYAVAHVTVNRVLHENWPNTICNVVYQYAQFSWTLDRKRRNVVPQSGNKNWQRSLEIAHDVMYNGMRVSALDNSYFYHANYVRPKWAAAKRVVTTIDTHIFYAYREN